MAFVVIDKGKLMLMRKPRLIEINENIMSILLRQRRGEPLTDLQARVLQAWEATGEKSLVMAFRQRPWLKGEAVVFRDMSESSLSKWSAERRAERMQ